MNALDVLVDEFPGEEAWSSFVEVFRLAWENVSDKDHFIREIGDADIAIVLNARMGHEAITWVKQPIGALEQKSVLQVLKAGPPGETAVKSLIMRMPV
jgi:hypothetical protein